jgi:hypothetical protein
VENENTLSDLVRVRFLAALAVAALLVAFAGDARAFCRTTTVQVPAGYDPHVKGCWTEGMALAWSPGPVPFSISAAASRQIPLTDAARIAQVAFNAWNDAPCIDGPPSVQAFYNGPVAADAANNDCAIGPEACEPTYHDPLHVIVFRDDRWPHNDPANTLALTTVTFGIDSAEIFDADIEINSAQHKLSAQEPPPGGAFDLQAILTHEAGHFFGLAHATSETSVMFAFYHSGAINLTEDDIDGVCSIYPKVEREGCFCSPGAPPAPGAAMTAAVALLGLAAVTAYRWRTRPSRLRRRTR